MYLDVTFSSFFYNILGFMTSCDCGHMPLHHPRIKRKRKEKEKSNQRK